MPSKCISTVKRADIFGQDLNLVFENGRSKLQSIFGVVLGFIMTVLLLLYAAFKFQIMLDYGANIILEPLHEQHFDNDYSFGSEQGFQVAFAMTAYDSSPELQAGTQSSWYETYGRLVAKQKVWGERDASSGELVPTYFRELEIEPCKSSDFA